MFNFPKDENFRRKMVEKNEKEIILNDKPF